MQKSSISSAFSTVQAVEEAFIQDGHYPDEVVYPSTERRISNFWVVSKSGEILASSNPENVMDQGVWALTGRAVDGNILENYEHEGSSQTVAGSISDDGSHWTLVAISSSVSFTTVIWLIFAILALSLMSVTAVIAVRFLDVSVQTHSDEEAKSHSNTLASMEIGGDGAVSSNDPSPIPNLSKLHEAVLQTTKDIVLVLDQDRNVVYSSLNAISDENNASELSGITGFADQHLDDVATARFENWLAKDPSGKPLTMDVIGSDGSILPTRWKAKALDLKSGSTFQVFLGRILEVEEFPAPVAR